MKPGTDSPGAGRNGGNGRVSADAVNVSRRPPSLVSVITGATGDQLPLNGRELRSAGPAHCRAHLKTNPGSFFSIPDDSEVSRPRLVLLFVGVRALNSTDWLLDGVETTSSPPAHRRVLPIRHIGGIQGSSPTPIPLSSARAPVPPFWLQRNRERTTCRIALRVRPQHRPRRERRL